MQISSREVREILGFIGVSEETKEKIKRVIYDALGTKDYEEYVSATLREFEVWEPRLRGLPLAIVLQNGQETNLAPWSKISAVFVGGDDKWKLGPEVREIVKKAKLLGKWVHMGRVNGCKRLRYAQSIGCDSVDGTGWLMQKRFRIREALTCLTQTYMAV